MSELADTYTDAVSRLEQLRVDLLAVGDANRGVNGLEASIAFAAADDVGRAVSALRTKSDIHVARLARLG